MTENYVKNGIVSYKKLVNWIKETDPYSKEIYNRQDDLSLSRLFAKAFADYARFNATAKEWYYYDGRVWKRDVGAMNTETYMKKFVDALCVYATTCVQDSDYRKFVEKFRNRTGRKRIIEDARDFNFIEQTVFDQDPNLFNCLNCVIDLKTGRRREHDPSLLLSKISNVWYDPDAKSEDFLRFLHEVMEGDEGKIQYLQKIFGYCLTGENTQEQCYMCYGPSTRNGKSTLLDTIGYLFGDYGMNIKPESLAQRDRDSRTASGDIARLDGCRFLHMSEPPKRMKFDVALLKTLLGRDPITARHLHEREFEFIPIFKLVINTNYLPVVLDDTLFSSGRVKVILFNRSFTPEEQDCRLKGRLKQRPNISGIFNWCLEGLRLFDDEGGVLREPDSVKHATEEYRLKSDKIQNFIDENFFPSPRDNISIKDAYHVFEDWCRENGFGTENKTNFVEEIRSKGIFAKSGTINGKTVKNVIKGYSLCDDFSDVVNPFEGE